MEALLATRIRNYRERLNQSPEELAQAAGLDAVLVRAIEAGEVYPALGVLIKLARALGQRLGTFMDDQFQEDPRIVRLGERQASMAQHKETGEIPYTYFPLGAGKTDRHMEPFFVVIEPHKDIALSSHEGEEFIVVVSGQVELTYGTKKFVLDPGDSMYYNSVVPHFVGTTDDARAELYAVIFMPM